MNRSRDLHRTDADALSVTDLPSGTNVALHLVSPHSCGGCRRCCRGSRIKCTLRKKHINTGQQSLACRKKIGKTPGKPLFLCIPTPSHQQQHVPRGSGSHEEAGRRSTLLQRDPPLCFISLEIKQVVGVNPQHCEGFIRLHSDTRFCFCLYMCGDMFN